MTARLDAVGALRTLSSDDKNAREMWNHVGTRAALDEASAVGIAGAMRAWAVGALNSLASVDNRRGMWQHEDTRAGLVDLGGGGQRRRRRPNIGRLRAEKLRSRP